MKTIKKQICVFVLIIAFIAGTFGIAGIALKFDFKRQDIQIIRTGEVITLAKGNFRVNGISTPSGALTALDNLSDIYGYENAADEFVYLKTINTAFGKIYKFKQYYKGFEVFGRGLNINVGNDEKILSVSGNYLKLDEVQGIAEGVITDEIISYLMAECVLLIKYPEARILSESLCVYSLENTAPVLAYNFMTDLDNGTRVFINACDGRTIAEISAVYEGTIPTEPYPSAQTDYFNNSVPVTIEKTVIRDDYYLADCLRNIYIYDANNSYDIYGTSYVNQTGVFTDKVAVSAFINLVNSFDFYTNAANIGVPLFGADGSVNNIHDDADESGEIIISAFLHFGEDYQNAAYVSGLKEEYPKLLNFVFGDGVSGGLYNPAVALDVVGHEYQHAVTAYTSDLIYMNQSGALNEAYSDIFGALIEGNELNDNRFWLCGEDAKSGGLRNMANPSAFGDPWRMSGAYPFCYKDHNHSTCDNGGVHYNSNIITHAMYQTYMQAVSYFTKERIGTLWYSVLGMLPQDVEFADFQVLLTHTAELLGYSQQAINAIAYGFNYVGINGTDGSHTITFNKPYDFTGNLPATITKNWGEEFVIGSTNLQTPAKEVIGWSEDGTTNKKVYYIGKTYKMPAYNLNLFPVAVHKMWNNLEPTELQGEGTPLSPFLITSAADLATVAYYLNYSDVVESPHDFGSVYTHYKLTKNLDLQNIPWIPIGNSISQFRATFDGDYHYIENLNISFNESDEMMYQGLFGYVRGAIKNLGIKNGSINTFGYELGAIAGEAQSASFINCYNSADITNANPLPIVYTAGIVGYSLQTDFSGCYNTGNISGFGYTAGIVGYENSNVALSGVRRNDYIGNCYNTGTIIGTLAGGIASIVRDVRFINCINTGDILNASFPDAPAFIKYYAGGIVASVEAHNTYFSESAVLGCKNTGKVGSAITTYAGAIAGAVFEGPSLNQRILFEKNIYKAYGGLGTIGNYNELPSGKKSLIEGNIGHQSSDGVFMGDFAFDSESYYRDEDKWVYAGGFATSCGIYDIGIEWKLVQGGLPVPQKPEYWLDYRALNFAGGDGSTQNPYKISSAAELALLAYLVNNFAQKEDGLKHYYSSLNYVLTRDIDLSGKGWTGIGFTYFSSNYTYGIEGFYGVFDGAGYAISNMRGRDRNFVTTRDYGTFGVLRLECSSYASLFSVIGETGMGRIPYSVRNVNIENCYNIGYFAAGIAAELRSFKYVSEIENCEISGRIVGNTCGGIVAAIEADNGSIISFCVNRAMVFGGSAAHNDNGGAGGIVGKVKQRYKDDLPTISIKNCVNTGNIISYDNPYTFTGGIVGTACVRYLNIENCINTGDIINYNCYGISGGIIGGVDLFGATLPSRMDINITNCKQVSEIVSQTMVSTSRAGSIFGSLFRTTTSINALITLTNNYYNTGGAVLPLTGIQSPENAYLQFADAGNYYSVDALNEGDFDFDNILYFMNAKYFSNMNISTANELYKMLNGYYPSQQYTYTFYDYNGAVLKMATENYGTVITPPNSPYRVGNAEYVYSFSHWSGFTAGMLLTENKGFTAVYTSTKQKYACTFYDYNGWALELLTLEYGTVITAPNNPTRAATAEYTYTFSHWNDFTAGMILTGNKEFTAVYTSVKNSYVYTFYDYDGAVLKTLTTEYGTVITAPSNPTRTATAEYTYTFSHWNGFTTGMLLTENKEFTAVYTSVKNSYTYTFYDYDGAVLKTLTTEYGTIITAPSNPTRTASAEYTYTFSHWSGFTEGMMLTGNKEFTAVYTSAKNSYTYTFYDYDNEAQKTITAEYGTVITAPSNPMRMASAEYTYTFSNWNGFTTGMLLTENKEFTAVYTSVKNSYTYTFYDYDGAVLKTLTTEYGTVITAPSNPTRAATSEYTYTFSNWNGLTAGMTLTGNVEFTAVYTSVKNNYTYTFFDYDNEVLKTVMAEYGTVITAPKNPTRTANAEYTYTFSHWDGFTAEMLLTENKEFTAVYTAKAIATPNTDEGCGNIGCDNSNAANIFLVVNLLLGVMFISLLKRK